MSKSEKEKLKLIQEKCQSLLNDMLRDEDNKYCVDCDAKGPRWASWNLGIFLCIRCAGIHRNLGVHISRVKSVNLDSWTPEQVVTMQQMGNSRARAVYEANMPDGLRRPQTDSTLESFIRAKYEHKKYIAKEYVQSPPVKVNWDSEIEESMRKAKEAKKSGNGTGDIGPLPTPVSKPHKTSPAPVAKPPVIDVGKVVASHGLSTTTTPSGPPPIIPSSASEDLLGLTVSSTPTTGSTNLFSTQDESNNAHFSSSTTNITSPHDDLGSIFASSSDTSPSIDLGKMSKESILKLYGSAPSTPVNPFVQGGGGSPFGNINLQSVGSTGGGANNSPFAQMGYGYPPNPNSNLMGQPQHSTQQQPSNSFSGLNQLGMSAYGGAASHQNDMTQVQNQLFGLNLGHQSSTSSQPIMPSNLIRQNNPIGNFGSVQSHPPPQTFPQIPTNLMGPQMNTFMSTPTSMYQTTKADNLPGLGNSVSQLMQPRLSETNFWK